MSDLSGRLSGGQAISGSLSGGSTLRGGLSMGGVSPELLLDKADVITDTASGSIVSIPDGMASPVLGLDVEIEPIQSGTGDPSPDNIRPISGRSEVNVYLEETYDAQATPKATIQLGQTVYGGKVSVPSGKLTISYGLADLSDINWGRDTNRPGVFYGTISGRKGSSYIRECDTYATRNISVSTAYDMYISGGVSYGGNAVFLRDTRYAGMTSAEFKAVVSGHVIYELATPVEVTLTAEELDILFGDNNIWADTGDTAVEYRCDTKKYILKKIAEALNA